jgi:hypothetical protein
MMARARRQLDEAELLERTAHRALVQAHAEAGIDPGSQILQSPTHHVVPISIRPALDDLRQRLTLRLRQLGPLPRGLAVDQPGWTSSVEGHHPVPHRLKPHHADPSRIRPAAALVDLGQRQQPAALARIAACSRQTPEVVGGEIFTQQNGSRHGKPSRFASSNQICRRDKTP